MTRRLLGSVAGALAGALLACAALAPAASAANVTVRVEAPERTLVSTLVRTTSRQVVKDGQHACGGGSGAGALQLATNGRWEATWFDGLGYAVDAVDGVRPSAPTDFWALWLNGKMAMVGLCDMRLQNGDELLLFICHSGPDFACTNRPLALIAPRRVAQAGRATAIRVVTLADDGTTQPAAGATVTGGVRAVRADAKGVARVVLDAGHSTLRATQAGNVPSAPLHCLVDTQARSCGSSDRTPPQLQVNGIEPGQAFGAASAPRKLRGTVRDPLGARVELRLVRTADGRCSWFDARRAAFRGCGGAGPRFFAVGDRESWSYLLPRKLAAGRYVLTARATDGAGNRATDRVAFSVRAAR